jgi:hypothetical protein
MLYNKRWDKPVVVTEPWRKYLLDAADIIEARGHCHGMVEDAQGRVCIAGALSIAAYGKVQREGRYDYKARRAADQAWGELHNRLDCHPVDYNDLHSGAEVVAVMRDTALSNG